MAYFVLAVSAVPAPKSIVTSAPFVLVVLSPPAKVPEAKSAPDGKPAVVALIDTVYVPPPVPILYTKSFTSVTVWFSCGVNVWESQVTPNAPVWSPVS